MTITPEVDASGVPFTFALTMAVHPKDAALRAQVSQAIVHLQSKINSVLDQYSVPRADSRTEVR